MPEKQFQDPVPENRPAPQPVPDPKPGNYCAARDGFRRMTNIQNIPQLIDYVKRMLGSPRICVEIDDDTILYIIKDIVDWFHKYYLNYGNYHDYLVLELIPGVTKYKLCQELVSVVDFKTTNWFGSINELFTVPHALLYDQVMNMNTWHGNCYGNTAAYGNVLGSWTATLTWLAEADQMFGEKYTVRYNELEQELEVMPSPRKPTKGLMQVYKRQRTEKMFNDPLFRKMLVAEAGKVWTNSLRKYNLQIAGGGTLNADSLYSSYEKDYDWCIERIDQESPNGHCMAIA